MNLKNLVLGIGIVIVFALVLWQGIEVFSPTPQWNDFCSEPERIIRDPAPEPMEARPLPDFKECQEEYEVARDKHSQIVFYISIIVAILAIILGLSTLSVEPVGSSLIASGVWAILWGSAINWNNFATLMRFILLLLALIILIWLTIRLNTSNEKTFWRKLGIRN
jgi:hypothetical protein